MKAGLDAVALHGRIHTTTREIQGRFGLRQQQFQICRDISPEPFVACALQDLGARGPHLQVYSVEGAEVSSPACQAAVNELGVLKRALRQEKARR